MTAEIKKASSSSSRQVVKLAIISPTSPLIFGKHLYSDLYGKTSQSVDRKNSKLNWMNDEVTGLDFDRDDVRHVVVLWGANWAEWVGVWVRGPHLHRGGTVWLDTKVHQALLFLHHSI